MKRKIFISGLYMGLIFFAAFQSCKKSPTAIVLGTLMAGNIDLNSATAPSNVPVLPTITATFTTNVDMATATAGNITLTEDYDNANIPLTLSVSGSSLTITPNSPLANGALYRLAITSGLKATNGQALTAINRSFTTLGSFLPAGVFAYWNFDGNANDQTGAYNAATGGVTAITYVSGRNSTAGQAAQFNGTSSLIQIPNGDVLGTTSDFTLSFWMKSDTTAKRDQFVMGVSAWYGFQFEYNSNVYGTGATAQIGQCKLAAQYSYAGATPGSTSQDLWLDGQGATKDNGGWQGWTFSKNLVANNGTGVNGLLAQKWAQVVITYDHNTKIGSLYINGQLMKAQDFNLYPAPLLYATGLKYAGAAGNNTFVFGFIQDKVNPTVPDSWAMYSDPTTGHFKGLLDDVAIYHKVLSASIITQMYNSGK